MTAKSFKKGDVVWAKIKGFPWWPAVIADVDNGENGEGETEILTNFIGEFSHACLPPDKVANYKEYYDTYSKSKKKGLLESIAVADKIIKGETTYDLESQKLLKEAQKSPGNSLKSPSKGKRKTPEKQDGEQQSSDKESVKEHEESNSKRFPAKITESKPEEDLLTQMASEEDPKKIIKKQKKIEEFLENIMKKEISIPEIQESKIGHSVQRFVNLCSKSPTLDELKKSSEKVLEKLKEAVYVNFFGETDKKLLAPKIQKNEEKETPKIPIRKEFAAKEIVKSNVEKKEQPAITTPAACKNPPKDQLMMIEICQQLAKLLEEKTTLNKDAARAKAIEIENKLRAKDEEMGTNYQEAAVIIINMLKESKQLLKVEELSAKLSGLT